MRGRRVHCVPRIPRCHCCPAQCGRAGWADAHQCGRDEIDDRPKHDRSPLARRRLWLSRRRIPRRRIGLSWRLWISRTAYGYRGGYGYRGYGYRGLGYGLAAGALVGGAIASSAYYGGGYYGDSYAAAPYGYGGGYGYGYGGGSYCPPYGGYARYYGW